MKHYGLDIAEGSHITNMSAPTGVSFPGSPNAGELFFRTDLDVLYVYNNTTWVELGDGTGSTTSQAAANRNYIINGQFEIWQRGITFNISNDEYTADRWYWSNAFNTVTATLSRETSINRSEPTFPTKTSAKITINSVGTDAHNHCILQQNIENVHVFSGRTVVLSFDAKATLAQDIFVEFVQNFIASPQVITAGGTVSLTTGWKRYEVTVTLPSTTNVTTSFGNRTSVNIWYSAGSNHSARTNSLGIVTAGQVLEITNVQFELGSKATPYILEDQSITLAKCRRYYENSWYPYATPVLAGQTNAAYARAQRTSNFDPAMKFTFTTLKRTYPTFTIYNLAGTAGQISNVSQGTSHPSGVIAVGHTSGGHMRSTNSISVGEEVFAHWEAEAEL